MYVNNNFGNHSNFYGDASFNVHNNGGQHLASLTPKELAAEWAMANASKKEERQNRLKRGLGLTAIGVVLLVVGYVALSKMGALDSPAAFVGFLQNLSAGFVAAGIVELAGAMFSLAAVSHARPSVDEERYIDRQRYIDQLAKDKREPNASWGQLKKGAEQELRERELGQR